MLRVGHWACAGLLLVLASSSRTESRDRTCCRSDYYHHLIGEEFIFNIQYSYFVDIPVRQIRTMESVRIGAGTLMDVFSGD